MNHQIDTYAFNGSTVRIHTSGEQVEYCARDIATALGYTNTSKAIGDHCKGVTNRYPLRTAGGMQEAVFISEGDVYRLIVSSQLPNALAFEHWLFDEVVPQIRRTGGYIPIQENDDEKSILARAVLIAQSALADKDRIIAAQRTRIAQAEPLALTAQALCDTAGSMTLTDAARHFMQLDPRMNRTRVIATLRTHGYLERNSLAPTRKATDPGYLKPIIGTRRDGRLGRQYSHFTTKGMGWFINRFIYGNAQGTLTDTTTEA
ncbi:BRO family protein [Bifidobacterium pseudolongum]|uniref:BRO family protein n=1 Tax=Bifidobacterium pseudolongum TaxID=1694 RepID=UPI0010206CF0|nr:BRO family protein [Bifidobacterium pseudolongum]RYQ67028.1 antirepressor [Bifidobacterium pseudolongum subsp. globosum]